MITVRNVVEIMNFKIKLNEKDINDVPVGQPINVQLIFKDKSIPTYCEYHTKDIVWLTCNSLWYLISSAIMIESKPKEIFRSYDVKHKINHFEFCKSKANYLKELVGQEIYDYLIKNVDVSQRY